MKRAHKPIISRKTIHHAPSHFIVIQCRLAMAIAFRFLLSAALTVALCSACTCDLLSLQDAKNHADVVFRGTIAEIANQ